MNADLATRTASSKYEQLEEVGHGGMAVVYRGRDRVLDREVAIKVLHPHLADRLESRERLHREALTVAKLRHPNIVEIYDYSSPEQGSSFIVTEFIHGKTLRWWLDGEWKPRPVFAMLVTYRLAEALVHAHSLGVVHRDIKPENVMIRKDGCVKLMDFGIAHFLDHQKLTMTGQLLGSPAYMAPEMIDGQPVDERSDVFSLAVLLYQLATGELPFTGRNPHEVLRKIASADYPQAKTHNPRVDEEMEAILAKALARDVQDRYASAQAFADDLAGYLKQLGIDAEGPELAEYFCHGEPYAQTLDRKLCDTLVQCADKAQRDGQHAKALNEVGRALEIEAEHPAALELLGKIQARGQRMRRVLLVTAAVGVVGIAAAGLMLMRQPASAPWFAGADASETSQGESRDLGGVQDAPEITGGALPVAKASDAPPHDRDPSKTGLEAVPGSSSKQSAEPESEPRQENAAVFADNATVAEPSYKPNPDEVSAKSPSSKSAALERGSEAAGVQTQPAVTPGIPNESSGGKVEAPNPRSADSVENTPGSAVDESQRGARNRSTNSTETAKKRVLGASDCRVFVERIPVPARLHYALYDKENNARYRLSRTANIPIQIPLQSASTTLELRAVSKGGHQSYEGSLRIRKEQCGQNKSPLHLKAKALPALLKFRALNFRLEDLVVQCIRSCGGDTHRKRMATAFSRIQLPPDALEQRVRFRFWAEGYKKLEKTFRLRPGYNELPIRLESLDASTPSQ